MDGSPDGLYQLDYRLAIGDTYLTLRFMQWILTNCSFGKRNIAKMLFLKPGLRKHYHRLFFL